MSLKFYKFIRLEIYSIGFHGLKPLRFDYSSLLSLSSSNTPSRSGTRYKILQVMRPWDCMLQSSCHFKMFQHHFSNLASVSIALCEQKYPVWVSIVRASVWFLDGSNHTLHGTGRQWTSAWLCGTGFSLDSESSKPEVAEPHRQIRPNAWVQVPRKNRHWISLRNSCKLDMVLVSISCWIDFVTDNYILW